MFIAFEEYKNIEAPGMSVVEKIGLGVGTIAIVVGVASTATGVGATWGVPLMYLGYTIEATIIADECYFDNEGGHNWMNCGISVGALVVGEIGGELAGSLMKSYGSTTAKLISKNINKITRHFNPKALSLFLKESDNLADTAKKLSVGISIISKNSDDLLEPAIRNIPDVYDNFAKIRIISKIGDFIEGVKFIGWDDIFAVGTRNVDELIPKLSKNGKRVFDESISSGDNLARASEAVSFSNFEKRGASLKYTERLMKDGKKFDFVVSINNLNYPVSVKRLTTTSPTTNNLRTYLIDAVDDMDYALNNLPLDTYVDERVLNYLVKNSNEELLLKEAFEQLKNEGQIGENVLLVVTKVPTYLMG